MRVLAIVVAKLAWADPAGEVYEIHAHRDDAHPGATVLSVDLEERADEQVSVAEALGELPGLQLRTQGGMGTYAALSVRGSAPSQVAVYLDGVPVNRGAFGAVDLSEFSIEGLERLEVWRGLPPPDRMGAGLGGVIELVPRRTKGGELRVTGGSFGTRGVLARGTDRRGRASYGATASYLGSEGDFEYLDHNGTLFDPDDDRWVTRRNNGFDQADAMVHGRYDGELTARVTQNVFYKTQGVPGALTTVTNEPQLDMWRSVSRLTLGQPGVFEGAGYATVQGDHYGDPLNEVGLGAQDQRSQSLALGGELRATWVAGPSVLVVVPQIHHEHYEQDDALAAAGDGRLEATRLVAGGAIFDVLSLLDGRLTLQPALRIDRYSDEATDGDGTVHALVSPRAGARFALLPTIDLNASAGRYHRAPTFVEMFGDRGFLVGNPELTPERGLAADSGIRWRGPVRIETTFHVAWVDDLILFAQNSQETVRAQNIGRARLLGTETSVTARPWSRLRAHASYAFLSPKNLVDGRQLPGRGRHEIYGRLDGGPLPAGPVRAAVFGDVEALAGMFLDAANLRPAPIRVLLGAGLKLSPRRWPKLTFTLEGKNLTDARTETVEIRPGPRRAVVATQDYLGFALPGRAFYATGRMIF